MPIVRLEWILLAVLTAAFGAIVASEPMLEITSCEVGLFPTQGVNNSAECLTPIAGHYGYSIILILALPVLLCLLPAVITRRWFAWLVAMTLLVGSVRSLFTSTPVFVLLGYYLPVALVAVLLAASHRRLNDGGSSTLRAAPTR